MNQLLTENIVGLCSLVALLVKKESTIGLIIIREKKSLGYFFYVDAANLPGRLVKMELDGTICQHTGILVNFWVNDMTLSSARSTLPPNINMNFIGRRRGRMVKRLKSFLHRFLREMRSKIQL